MLSFDYHLAMSLLSDSGPFFFEMSVIFKPIGSYGDKNRDQKGSQKDRASGHPHSIKS
jgi:hypothetical protein